MWVSRTGFQKNSASSGTSVQFVLQQCFLWIILAFYHRWDLQQNIPDVQGGAEMQPVIFLQLQMWERPGICCWGKLSCTQQREQELQRCPHTVCALPEQFPALLRWQLCLLLLLLIKIKTFPGAGVTGAESKPWGQGSSRPLQMILQGIILLKVILASDSSEWKWDLCSKESLSLSDSPTLPKSVMLLEKSDAEMPRSSCSQQCFISVKTTQMSKNFLLKSTQREWTSTEPHQSVPSAG